MSKLEWYAIRLYFKLEELKMRLRRLRVNAVISFDDLRFADVISTSPIKPDIAARGIQIYQILHLYTSWRHTHVATFVGDAGGRFGAPMIFECTYPYARYYPLADWYRPEKKIYFVNRYADAVPNTSTETLYLELFDRVKGTVYDVGDLVDFVIQSILGYPASEWHSWFNLGKDNMVCSVVARAAQMQWYNKILQYHLSHRHPGVPCRRPGGDIHIERTPPALFNDHDTYLSLGRLIS